MIQANGSNKTYYFYNTEGLIAEADASGQIIRSYGYVPGSTFSTNPLFTKVGNAYYTYQNDHLGTPQKLLNQSGVTVWSATYDAYGNATVDPASTITNNLRFPGQYYDAETGLHYNYFRYYDPNTGRYITSDPIGLEGGLNLFTYAFNNPLSYTDPNGLLALALPALPAISEAVAGAIAGTGIGIGICAVTGMCNEAHVNNPEAQREHDAYKERASQTPPPNLDECERLKWLLKREQDVVEAIQRWDAKWLPGRHTAAIQQRKNAIEKLKQKIKQQCEEDCPK